MIEVFIVPESSISRAAGGDPVPLLLPLLSRCTFILRQNVTSEHGRLIQIKLALANAILYVTDNGFPQWANSTDSLWPVITVSLLLYHVGDNRLR